MHSHKVDLIFEIKKCIELAIEQIGISFPENWNNKHTVELILDREFGDFSTNAAMILAKTLGKNPMHIGDDIKKALMQNEKISDCKIEGRGFINISANDFVWLDLLKSVISAGKNYGIDKSCAVPINIEFVSANPTGPMHIGHARAAVLGDIIARMHENNGFKVSREFYINDGGSQIDQLASSVASRISELEGETINESELPYKGNYIKDIAIQILNETSEKKGVSNEKFLRKCAVEIILENIKTDLKKIGVRHDIFISEESIVNEGLVEKALNILAEGGHTYVGRMPKIKGIDADDHFKSDNLLIFKSTNFGDDEDRVLKKDTGEYVYFAKDIAYHMSKISRGHLNMLVILGGDHCGYVERLKAAIKCLNKEAKLNVVLHGLVSVEKYGSQIKMSKREGTIVLASELLQAIEKDPMRFILVSKRSNTPIAIDLELLMSTQMNNPFFYVNYAYSRLNSAIGNAVAIDESCLLSFDGWQAPTPEEKKLLKIIAGWPQRFQSSMRALEPNWIYLFLIEIAESIHAVWSSGIADENKRFIGSGKILSKFRIQLLLAARNCIEISSDILGINLKKRM